MICWLYNLTLGLCPSSPNSQMLCSLFDSKNFDRMFWRTVGRMICRIVIHMDFFFSLALYISLEIFRSLLPLWNSSMFLYGASNIISFQFLRAFTIVKKLKKTWDLDRENIKGPYGLNEFFFRFQSIENFLIEAF